MSGENSIYTSLSYHTVFFVFLLLSLSHFCLVLVLSGFFSVASEEFPAAIIINAHKDYTTVKAGKQSC